MRSPVRLRSFFYVTFEGRRQDDTVILLLAVAPLRFAAFLARNPSPNGTQQMVQELKELKSVLRK